MASSLARLPAGNLTAPGIGASTGICLCGIPSGSHLPTLSRCGGSSLRLRSGGKSRPTSQCPFPQLPLPCARNGRCQAGEIDHPFADILDSQTTDEPRDSKVRVFIEDFISTIFKVSVAAFIWGYYEVGDGGRKCVGPSVYRRALCFPRRRELVRPHRLCGACTGWNQPRLRASAEIGGKRLVGLLDLRNKSTGTRG